LIRAPRSAHLWLAPCTRSRLASLEKL